MADIFREVDEEVRRDKALEFWSRYQNYIIGLAIIIVAATAGWRAYDTWRTREAEQVGAKFDAAMQLARDGKSDEAAAAFQGLTTSDQKGYALLARLRAADELAAKDRDGAVKAYDALAGDASVGALLQDVARVRAALLRVDDAEPDEVRRRLEPLASAGNPFRHTARELLALAALRANDLDTAGKWLDMLVVDQQTPVSLRQRAEALLGLVSSGKPSSP